MRHRRLLALVLALATVAMSCGGGASAAAPAGDADRFLIDEFETLSGETIDLASLQGEDVVLWFWAPW